MRSVRRQDKGFTLVEMLIALFIFSLLSAGAMSAMFASIQTKERLSEAVTSVSEIETSRAIMKADLSNLVIRPVRDTYGNPELYLMSGGNDTLLSFSRAGRENPGGIEKRGGLQRVAYVFEDGSLIRRSFGVDNPAPASPVLDRVLVANLENATVSFEDERLSYSQLYVDNQNPTLTVDLMVLTLTFRGGQDLVQKFELRP